MSQNTAHIIQKLNPSDCFTLAMDEEIRQENMPGSLCGFALELTSMPDLHALQQRIDEFGTQFPIAHASLQQRGKRFFWCQRENNVTLFYHHVLDSDTTKQHKNRVLQQLSQQQKRDLIAPIEFHLISSASKHTFLIRWIHPFCDARGAELILSYLCTNDAEKRQQFDKPKLGSLVELQLTKYRWWQKIAMFMQAKRYISELDTLSSIIHADTRLKPKQLNFKTVTLSIQQTQKINRLSKQYVGLTGTSLYYMGCFMRALQHLAPDQKGEAYCAPYAFNLRKSKALSPLLSNHVGPLFAQVPKPILADREALFTHLKQQNANSIRAKLDYAFLPVMWAASWLSLTEHGKNIRKSYLSGNERSSFWFSDIGMVDLNKQQFFNSDINKIYHLCQISSPPAIAFLSCQFKQQLTISYNFIEPLFSRQWIDALHEQMLIELLSD